MSETSEAKSKRKFLSIASKYEWSHQSTIFFSDDESSSSEVVDSKYIANILPSLKKHIRDNNPNTPILFRIQFHLKDSKVKELPTKQQIIIVMYSPVELTIPIFNLKCGYYKSGVIKVRSDRSYYLNLKQKEITSQFEGKMRKILNSKSHLNRINDFIEADKQISQYTVINSKYLSNYERESPITFKKEKEE